MDLVKAPKTQCRKPFYTCPMPEVIQDAPGSCPICGMDLVPRAVDTEENKSYLDLLHKMKVACYLPFQFL
jgi:Cu2+-exporting ATPase